MYGQRLQKNLERFFRREKVTIQCAKCESSGEVEDEDFNYDYSGVDTDKLQ